MILLQRIIPAAVVSLLLALAVPGLAAAAAPGRETTLEDVQRESEEFLRTLTSYGVAQRDEAIRKTGTVLADLDTHIEALEAQIDAEWESMSKVARAEAQASLKALRRQRNAVAEAYGRLREGSAAGWEELKQGFAAAYSELQRSWEKAQREFGAKK